MQRKNFYFIFLFLFNSCRNTEKSKPDAKDTVSVSAIVVPVVEKQNDSFIKTRIIDDIKMPTIDTNGNAANVARMKKAKVEIKVFRNTEISGFGYDIILEGKTYVHQPTIPALPGNNGFSTEEQARKVAELVSNKIRNNIMPPTVEVKELDSLGVN